MCRHIDDDHSLWLYSLFRETGIYLEYCVARVFDVDEMHDFGLNHLAEFVGDVIA